MIPLLTSLILAAAPGPTFHEDVQPILFAKCAGCHREGEVAPFALFTYEDAAKRAKQLARVTGNHYMPPWKPVAGWGDFKDARGLTDAEIAVFQKWFDDGMPKGDPKKAPPEPVFTKGWQLGKPDLIVKMPEAFVVHASGDDVYRAFVLPLAFQGDRDVSAVEFHPGNPRVDHHALLYLDDKGKARELDEKDPGYGYKSFGGPGFIPAGGLGGWAPGATPRRLPEGVAYRVPRDSDLVIQMHYHPSGREEADQSEVGIYFSKKPAEKRAQALMIMQRDLAIPANDANYTVKADFVTPIDLELFGGTPHMHWLGKSMKIWATLPDGSERKLLYIDDWDFNWQGGYLFKESIKLPKDTVLHLEASYDNSSNNPNNPNDPPKKVTWGEQTTDEMCIGFLQYATTNPDDRRTLFMSAVKQFKLWRFAAEFNRK